MYNTILQHSYYLKKLNFGWKETSELQFTIYM